MNNFDEIIKRMQSEYIPEHITAANQYIAKSYSILKLYDIVNSPEPNENLVSMFFYICGKGTRQDVLLAFNYLKARIIQKYNDFKSVDFSPHDLSPTNRYLLFSARKYLSEEKNLDTILEHIKETFIEYKLLLSSALRTLDEHKDKYDMGKYNNFNSKYIFYTRYEIEKITQTKYAGYNENLTESEIVIASKITTYSMFCWCDKILDNYGYSIALYFQWLKELIIPYLCKKYDIKKTLSEEQYIELLGYDNYYINFIKNKSNLFYQKNDKIQNDSLPIKQEIIEIFDLTIIAINNYYHEANLSYVHDNISYSDIPSKINTAIDRLKEVLTHSPVHDWIIFNILKNCDNKEFLINVLTTYRDILILYVEQNKEFDEQLFAFLKYIFFEQDVYKVSGLDFINNCVYVINKPVEYFEDHLFSYLSLDSLFNTGSKQEIQAYNALSVLIEKTSLLAYDFLRNIILDGNTHKMTPPASNYFDFLLTQLYIKLGGKRKTSEQKFEIGHAWERICQRIADSIYKNTIDNVHYQTKLTNGSIPDIIIGTDIEITDKGISHVPVIVECKKSIYFGEYSVLNNETTDKYIDFCDSLEYWILEKPENFIYPNYNKVKYIFADDLLENINISADIKNEIKELLKLSKNLRDFSFVDLSEIEKIKLIDYQIENQIYLNNNTRTIEEFKVNDCIRKYSMSGVFIKEYSNKKDAALDNNISIESIRRAISGERTSAGGFIWRKCDLKSPQDNIEIAKTEPLTDITILQISSDGEVISEFNSLSSASKSTGIDRKGIRDTINGRQKTAGGFYWTKKE